MSKRNKGHNAFYFFMIDWGQRQKAGNGSIPKSLKEIAADQRCSEEWKNLTPQQKGYYEAKAKESKVKAQGSVSKKTTLGECLLEVEAREKKEQEFQQNMLQYIDSVVSMGLQHKKLEKLKFIFIHVNWFYKREISINKYEFCPAEFAVSEFSLQNGIENIYHEVLKVKIPLGWKRDAIETSQQTHQIPIELEGGQDDFYLMFNKFVSILQSNMTGNKYPPLFTTKNLTLAVESLLIKLVNAGNGSIDDFLIYSLEALFGALRNASVQKVDNRSIPLVVAEIEFGKDVFSSIRGYECDFHKLIDGSSEYCSKSVVKRWGFTICDYCCDFLDMDLIENVHYPRSQSYVESNDQDTTSHDAESIDMRMKCLNLNDQIKVVEMNGVSQDHRMKVSERTYEQEQRRRNECKPLEIIDHSKFNTCNTTPSVSFRPLRLPKTTPHVVTEVEENRNPFNTDDFPPIGGRGVIRKKKAPEIKLPLGRGRGGV